MNWIRHSRPGDLRVLLRETAPSHELDTAQLARAGTLISDLQRQVEILRKELQV